MGIPDVAQLPGGSLSSIQPNPLKRTKMTVFDDSFRPVADGAECVEHISHLVKKPEEEEAVKKPAKKRKKVKDGDEEVRGRMWVPPQLSFIHSIIAHVGEDIVRRCRRNPRLFWIAP